MMHKSPHPDLVAEALQPTTLQPTTQQPTTQPRRRRAWRTFVAGVAFGFAAGAVCAAPLAIYLTVLLGDM
jgi:hypothetical protein